MYSDEGPSTRVPFLHGREVNGTDKEESSCSRDTKKEVVVDVTERNEMDSENFCQLPKPRPLNLADKYEIVGGIPALTGDYPVDYDPSLPRFVFSFDGTRLAVREHVGRLGIYNVMDNFSLVAKGDVKGQSYIGNLAFWKHTNDRLVVCYDGKVGLYSIVEIEDDVQKESEGNERRIGELSLIIEHDLIDGYEDVNKLRYDISSFEDATWICTRCYYNCYWILLGCLHQENEEGFRMMTIQSNADIKPTFTYMSNTQRALMGVILSSNGLSDSKTRIWKDIDVATPMRDDDPIVLNGESFGFSEDGKYFLVWEVEGPNTQHLKLYKISELNKTQNTSLHTKTFKGDIFRLRASFVENSKAFQDNTIIMNDGDIPLVGFMQILKTRVTFTIWNCTSGKDIKDIDLRIKEVTITKETRLDFSLSPNMKWIAIGCWTFGVIGLFSFSSGAPVWYMNVNKDAKPCHLLFSRIKFDPFGLRLLIDTYKTIYALAPACLLEDCKVDYECHVYDIELQFSKPFLNIDFKHQKLISKRLLWRALELQKDPFDLKKDFKILDVAISTTSDKIALLVNDEQGLLVLHGPFKSVLLQWYKLCNLEEVVKFDVIKDVDQFRLTESFPLAKDYDKDMEYWLFLCSNVQNNREFLVLFYVGNGISAIFIDLEDTKHQQLVKFSDNRGFYAYQHVNNRRAYIVKSRGVVVIDLTRREILHDVEYAQLYFTQYPLHKLLCLLKRYDLLTYTLSRDGKSILVGWNSSTKQRVILTSSMTQKELEVQTIERERFNPCWPLNEAFYQVASFELDETTSSLSSIVTYNEKENHLVEYTHRNWNPQMTRIISTLNNSPSCIYDLRFDESNGSLWLMVFQGENHNDQKLFLIPFNPYSMKGSIPNLNMLDHAQGEISKNELNEAIKRFGISFVLMPFNGKTSVRIALERNDTPLTMKLLCIALEKEITLNAVLDLCWERDGLGGFLKNAIKDEDEQSIKLFVNLMENKLLPFEDHATVMKECFKDLWLDYHSHVEYILTSNTLIWSIGEVNISVETLRNNKNLKARLGTSSSLDQWLKSYEEGRLTSYLKSTNEFLEQIENSCSPSKENAVLNIYCMKDACKIGLDGILRFLLMQRAPFYIYKTQLLKWVLIWKWERIWKERCLQELFWYIAFSIGFSVYAICIRYVGNSLKDTLWAQVFLSLMLVALMFMACKFWCKQYIQLRTYIKDGNKLFPNDPYWGIRHYSQLTWNIFELVTYSWWLTFIPLLHLICLFKFEVVAYLLCVVAVEVLLVWIKFWYFAQAFQQTGALVLLIENVVKDCTSFLLLASLILIGFSFSLFVLFQHYLRSSHGPESDDKQEIRDRIDASFGSPIKAILTLFYAMAGTFEPEVYLNCGSLAPLIIIIFVFYIAIEMIVMLNMLIAIMGDTFDRVKDTEEEQLLMGRARFIDACEASLTQGQIEEIEQQAEPYLYALDKTVEDQDSDELIWKGRVKTLQTRLRNDVVECNKNLSLKIKNVNEKVEEVKGQVENVQQRVKSFERIVLEKFEEVMITLNKVKQSRRIHEK